MTKRKISAELTKLEKWIRLGQLPQAARLFRELPLRRIPEEARLPLAQIARRLGLLSAGFRLLYARAHANAPTVQAEYAVLLLQNGNVREAAQLLDRVNLRSHPDLLLAKAWCGFEEWQYEPTLPLLQEYVRRQTDPYWNLAGRINLAEALNATGDSAGAIATLGPAVEESSRHAFRRLLANALHLRAQANFSLHRLPASQDDLLRALELYGRRDASDAILIRRQWAFNQAFLSRDVAPLAAFRQEALRAGAWESVRECDFQILRFRFRPALFARLYYGTPYPGYRRRLETIFGEREVPTSYLWGTRSGPRMDLARRTYQERKLTRQNTALVGILLGDFYRPFSAGEIFSSAFPGEQFDCFHSPVRVHQALLRLRKWMREAHVPLVLQCHRRRYHLARTSEISVLIPREPRRCAKLLLDVLGQRFGKERSFSVTEARQALDVSKATATRYLTLAAARQALISTGRGRATRYRVSSSDKAGAP